MQISGGIKLTFFAEREREKKGELETINLRINIRHVANYLQFKIYD